uniref:Proteasome assembly chaperone 3 n=1 Tax=Bursaphelenchus xylophilus TaxID=6326 RepID=A0A1I7RVV8_BURXY
MSGKRGQYGIIGRDSSMGLRRDRCGRSFETKQKPSVPSIPEEDSSRRRRPKKEENRAVDKLNDDKKFEDNNAKSAGGAEEKTRKNSDSYRQIDLKGIGSIKSGKFFAFFMRMAFSDFFLFSGRSHPDAIPRQRPDYGLIGRYGCCPGRKPRPGTIDLAKEKERYYRRKMLNKPMKKSTGSEGESTARSTETEEIKEKEGKKVDQKEVKSSEESVEAERSQTESFHSPKMELEVVQTQNAEKTRHVIVLATNNVALVRSLLGIYTVKFPPASEGISKIDIGLLPTVVQISSEDELQIFIVRSIESLEEIAMDNVIDVIIFCHEAGNEGDYRAVKRNLIQPCEQNCRRIPRISAAIRTKPTIERDIAGEPLVLDVGSHMVFDQELSGCVQTSVDLLEKQETTAHLFNDAWMLSMKKKWKKEMKQKCQRNGRCFG